VLALVTNNFVVLTTVAGKALPSARLGGFGYGGTKSSGSVFEGLMVFEIF
jgi:hypothetical protein